MIICAECGAKNPDDVFKCQNCAASFAEATPSDANQTYLVTNLLSEEEIGSTPWKWGQFLFEKDYMLVLQIKDTNRQMMISPRSKIILGRNTQPSEDTQPTDTTLVDFNPYDGLTAGVSRQHAVLSCNAHLVTVTDLGSTNGTRINGKKLEPNTPRLLREGDELQLGKLKLTTRFYKPEKLKRRISE